MSKCTIKANFVYWVQVRMTFKHAIEIRPVNVFIRNGFNLIVVQSNYYKSRILQSRLTVSYRV